MYFEIFNFSRLVDETEKYDCLAQFIKVGNDLCSIFNDDGL